MMLSDIWDFVRDYGLEGREWGALIVGLLAAWWTVTQTKASLHTKREELTYGHIFAPISFLGLMAACAFMLWYSTRTRLLLQPGAGRYTVGTIYQHKWTKGKRKYLLEYYVAGKRWQTDELCGIQNNQNLPCPPVGTRLYVYFALSDPNTARITAVPVPDSVRVVPPIGWVKLP